MGHLLRALVSWSFKTKTIYFDEEQIRRQAVCMDGRELSDSSTKVTDSANSEVSTDGATNTSRLMNEPITSIPKKTLALKIHFK